MSKHSVVTRGRNIPIPEIKSIFEIAINPFDKLPRMDELMEYIYSYSLAPRDYWDKNKDNRMFSSYFHPFCKDLGKYENLVKIMIWYQIVDDHTECKWGDINRDAKKAEVIFKQFNQAVDKLLYPDKYVSATDWKPYIALFYFTMESMFQDLKRDQQLRTAKSFKDYLKSYIKESKVLTEEDVPDTFETRVDSIGIPSVFSMLEYSEGIYITDKEWSDPLLQRYMRLVTISGMLINDVFSYEKEVNDAGSVKMVANQVANKMLTDKCSAEVAIAHIYDRWIKCEQMVLEVQKQLLAREDNSPDLIHFIKSAGYLMSGNVESSKRVRRYNVYTD